MWGFSKFISLCLPSAELGLSKPDLAIFELAMERSDCEPEHAVMVGDRIDNDITPAKSLGWKTIRIKQGLSQGQVPMNAEQVPDIRSPAPARRPRYPAMSTPDMRLRTFFLAPGATPTRPAALLEHPPVVPSNVCTRVVEKSVKPGS